MVARSEPKANLPLGGVRGPAIAGPPGRGFGTRAIEQVVNGHVGAEVRFNWRPEGVVVDIAIPERAFGAPASVDRVLR